MAFQFTQSSSGNPSPFGAQSSASQAPSATATAAPVVPKGMFGPAANAPTSGIFGAQSSASQAPAATATAAPVVPKGMFGPAANAPTSGLFGAVSGASKSPLFGPPSGTENQNPQDKPAGTTLFGTATPAAQKSLFANMASTTPSDTPPTTSGTQQKSLFGAVAGGSTGGGLFSQLKTADAPVSSPTLTFGTPAPAKPAQPFSALSSNAPQPSAQKTLFGTPTATPAATPTTTTTTSLFGQPAASTPASQPASTAPAAAPTLKLGSTTTAAPATSLFKTAGTPASTTAAPATTASTTAASAQSPTATAKPLFGQPAASQSQAPATQAAPSLSMPQNTPQFGTSSANPAQPASARLKNKSMDEILTRWATDLAKHQKEFQKQAMQVAEWDRVLVDNTDKIGKLLAKTFQAERDASEVEKQLSAVESQQEELDQYLERYEKEVDDMIQKHGLAPDNAGLDIERERTYKLAEKLTDRLDELNKDLTDVIEEINRASSLLSNTNGTDDPLSRVVRVLNSHLSQLQKIDMDAATLQAKVDDAQRQTRTMGGGDWRIGSDPTEEFYKSFSRR